MTWLYSGSAKPDGPSQDNGKRELMLYRENNMPVIRRARSVIEEGDSESTDDRSGSTDHNLWDRPYLNHVESRASNSLGASRPTHFHQATRSWQDAFLQICVETL